MPIPSALPPLPSVLCRRGERGSLAPSLAAMIVVLFLLGGLVIDGARQLGARSRAQSYAEEGARIAGQGLDFDQGRFTIDPVAVRTNAQAYCQRVSAGDRTVSGCTFEVVDGEVLFSVDLRTQTGMLGLVGINEMGTTGTGRAVAEIGITEAEGTVDGELAEQSEIDTLQLEAGEVPVGSFPPTANLDGCITGIEWTGAPAGEQPFYYIYRRDWLTLPGGCPVPPVCPNPEVLLDWKFRNDPTEDPTWQPLYSRCPPVEGILFGAKPPPPSPSNSPSTPDPYETTTPDDPDGPSTPPDGPSTPPDGTSTPSGSPSTPEQTTPDDPDGQP